MSKRITRRKFLQKAISYGAVLLLPRFIFAQTPNPPRSKFNADSTAEDVTRGLDLTGKTIMITGTNSGLGHEATRVLAMRGAHVIATVRTPEKAEMVKNSVTGKVTTLICELTDFNSVIDCAKQVEKLNLPLDALICNAGVMQLQELQTVHGLEHQFAVNYLGHFLLSQRLLPLLQRAPQGRLVLISSGLIRKAPKVGIEFNNLDGKKSYDPEVAYGHSKLAVALYAAEFARRFANSTVTANALHPGIIHTNLLRHLPLYKRAAATLFGFLIFDKSIEEGTATHCYVATHPSLENVSGHFFADCNPATPESPHFSNQKMAADLWETSMQLVKEYL